MISVCMITRNEEGLLRQAIASTEGLADEVVVVDTGSSDNTIALAEKFGARTFTGADRMHKAESRNRAIEEAKGNWVVILDADEKIADPVGLKAFLEDTDASAIFIRLAYKDGDQSTLSYLQMRCWHRDAYRYRYRCHEVPVPVNGWGKVEHTDFVWEHRPPSERGAWKLQYSLDRLLLDVEENPGDPRPLYYLGRQYTYLREWKKARKTLKQYLNMEVGRDRPDAWGILAQCHAKLGNKNAQVSALFQACACRPKRREWWGQLAEVYHAEGDDQIAVGLLRCALEIPIPSADYVNYAWYGAHIYDLMARCLWKLGRYEEGHEYATEAARLAPDDERLLDNLGYFERKLRPKAMEADYYNKVYADESQIGKMRQLAAVVAKHVSGSILDLGCGFGFLASETSAQYEGVDFSQVAIDYAEKYNARDNASFSIADIRDLWQCEFNTVALVEVLEHLDDPSSVVKSALRIAQKRIIATVPVDMPDMAHVKPKWSREDLAELFGDLSVCRQILDDNFWLVVKEVS